MYYIQTESKKGRLFVSLGEAIRAKERFFAARYVRMQYGGKPTKRYARLVRRLERGRIYDEKACQILRDETAALRASYGRVSGESDR